MCFSKKKFDRFVESFGVISLIEFLMFYVGIDIQLASLSKATHKDIKILGFEDVVTVPFELIDFDDLASGNIILVKDSSNNIGAYRNPLRVKGNPLDNIIVKKLEK